MTEKRPYFSKLLLTDSEFNALVDELAAKAPQLVRADDIGLSQDGRRIRLLTITDFSTGEDKPAYFVQGNIHSSELSGTLVGLHLAHRLVEEHRPGGILSRRVFYILPRCNPDGAQRVVETVGDERSGWGPPSSAPNLIDPSDLNGKGHRAIMRIEHPDGVLCKSERDPRCLVDRTPDSKPPFYMHMPEGYLRNWDGHTIPNWPDSYREEIDWNRNWPPFWNPKQPHAGTGPLSVPEVKLQAEWLLRHPNIRAALTLHNGYGMVIRSDVNEKDFERYSAIAQKASEFVGYPCVGANQPCASDVQTRQYGRFADFCYHVMGVYCLTIELGTREDSAGAGLAITKYRKNAYTAPYEVLEQQDAHPELPVCFFDWEEFDHPQLGKVELGGGCGCLFANPLLDFLEKKAEGVFEFAVWQAEDMVRF